MFSKLVNFLIHPTSKLSVLLLAGIGFIAGTVAVVGSFVMIDATNSNEFCISCHELRVPYEEFTESRHFKNRTGVSADCVQCHLPDTYPDKLFMKTARLKDVWHSLSGSIDTREKFEAKRLELATSVWDWLDTNESAPCQSCHNFASMNHEMQSEHSQKAHQRAQRDNRHCIECHRGFAHKLPDMKIPEAATPINAGEPVICSGCHEDITKQLPDYHPGVSEVVLETCLLCHIPGTNSPIGKRTFYAFMHESHEDRIPCSGCHENTAMGMKLLRINN
jgi:cytochrome c-type protein NapC